MIPARRAALVALAALLLAVASVAGTGCSKDDGANVRRPPPGAER